MTGPLLHASAREVLYLSLGAAIITIALVSAGIALLRRRFDPILFWFSLFALLYGGRLWWILSGLLVNLLPTGSELFPRLREAIDYLVPIPAFFFFRSAGYLTRFATLFIAPLAGIMLSLAAIDLLFGHSQRLRDINNVVVIASLLLLLSQALWGKGQMRELRIVRAGLIVFIATALWDNISGLLRFYLDLEPFGFAVFLATLGYVAAQRTLHRDAELAAVRTELAVAEEIQRSILPREFPHSIYFQVAARYVPMRSVAGDFYDYVDVRDTSAGLLIADVSGHGVPAALIASMVKLAAATQREQASEPAAVLIGMNHALCGNTQSQFVTAAYVHLDGAKAEMRYAAAAHPPMLLLRDGVVQQIAENGLMLGAFLSATYTESHHPLQPGDRLLLYTDGIVEAANAAQEEFGQERLGAAMRECARLSHEETADRLMQRVQTWSATQDDDLTLLVCDFQRA